MDLSRTVSEIKGDSCKIFPLHVSHTPLTELFLWNLVTAMGAQKN